MAQPKFTVYKHVEIDGKWRYCRAAAHSNSKLKQDTVIVRGREESEHTGRRKRNPSAGVAHEELE
jgi:hypothetical protein